MSHQVQIDYQAIAVQCQSVCEVAETRLQEFDTILDRIKNESTTLMQDRAVEFVKIVEQEKQKLFNQIQAVKEQAESVKSRGKVNSDTDLDEYRNSGNIIDAATELQQAADNLSSQRLIEFQSLLTTILDDNIKNAYRKVQERARGVVTIDEATQKILDSIDDGALRQFTYLAYLQNNTLSGKELILAGHALMDKAMNATYESRYAEEVAKIRAELDAAKLDAGIVEKAAIGKESACDKLVAVRETATQEIVGEKVRQKSLKIIMDAIKQRGFVVDKKNIKIRRDTNEVILVALKASGEKAEFRIFLDGKFIYDFRGYEGQACQKDIEPFMRDLEEVYGIKVTKQTEIWSNPDKISTMKYQAINTNKNKK